MVKAAERTSFTLWRVRGVLHGEVRELRCTMAQLGEGCFELRVQCGQELLRLEDFADAEQLPARAEQLRTERGEMQ